MVITSPEMFEKVMKDHKIKGASFLSKTAFASVQWFECKDEGAEDICLLTVDGKRQREKNYPVATAALLGHEVMHLVQNCMVAIGEDKPSKEFEAYLFQHIYEAVAAEYVEQVYGVDPFTETADMKRAKQKKGT